MSSSFISRSVSITGEPHFLWHVAKNPSLDLDSVGASNAQYARRNEPRDESSGDRRSRDGGGFVQCRVIICERPYESEIDCSAQTDDGDSIMPDFAKHRFATHSAERAIFLEGIR